MAFNSPSTRTSVDMYYDDKRGHKNSNMDSVSAGPMGSSNNAAEGAARTWASGVMQQILDNGIDLGENQENFEHMFTEISRAASDYDGEDIWGSRNASKIGPKEMTCLCFVMSDLNEMLDDGRIDMETYASTMGDLFSEESITALAAGGKLDKSAAFLNIANTVAEWHGDNPNSSRAKQPDAETAAANKAAMSIGERPIINEVGDYGENRKAEAYAERAATGDYNIPIPGYGSDPMYMSDHQTAMVEMIKDWEDQGLLPEGCDTQSLLNHVNTNMSEYYNTGYAPGNAYSLRVAMEDLNGLESEELKREMIAQLATPEGFDAVMFGEPEGVEWMSELDLYRLNPDLQVDLDVHSEEAEDEAEAEAEDEAEAEGEEAGAEEAESEAEAEVDEEEEAETEEGSQAEAADYDADVNGLDYSILVRDMPSERFEAVKARAIEYYSNGTQDDLDGGLAAEGFSEEEIQNIQRLSMYGASYIESLDADGYAGMFYDGRTMDEADAEFQQAQADAAVQVMTYEDPADFMDAYNRSHAEAVNQDLADQIYSSAAAVVSGMDGIDGIASDSVGLAEAVSNVDSYVAEGGEPEQHIDGLQDGSGVEVEEPDGEDLGPDV